MKPELVANYWILGLLAICSVFGFGCSGIEQPVAAVVDNIADRSVNIATSVDEIDSTYQKLIANRIIYISDDNMLYSVNPDGSDGQILFEEWGRIFDFALSPTKDKFAIAVPDGIYEIDILGEKSKMLVPSQGWKWAGLSWSPDGSKLAIGDTFTNSGHNESTIENIIIVDSNSGELIGKIKDGAFPIWSPDGRFIVFQFTVIERNNGLRVFNTDILRARVDGSDRLNLSNHPADDFLPSFSSNGKVIFKSDREKGSTDRIVCFYSVNLAGFELEQFDVGCESKISSYSLSPNGKQIVFNLQREQGLFVYTLPIDILDTEIVPIAVIDKSSSFLWAPP